MSALWPHWLRPGWLLLLPLLLWLGWQLWHRPHRSGRWQALIPPAFQPILLLGGDQRRSRLPWLALAAAWLLGLLALLGPSWQQVEEHPQKRADPLVVVLDLSAEMLASDTPPSRLEQARRKLLDLLEARGDAQTAIVVYAGSAHSLVPLSDDLLTARNLLEALKPSIMPVPGRRADLGVARALQLLQQGANGEGRILLISARLDDAEQQAIRQLLDKPHNRLDILGVGTPEGAPILQADGSFLKDENGGILLPRLDEGALQRFASDIGGRYSRASLDNRDLDRLHLLERAQSTRQASEPTRLQLWADAGHWLLLPLLLLAACAGRRGWLLVLPLLLVMPRPVYAFEFIDLWLTPDQQGARLLQKQQPAAAAEQFADPQWQGIALYQAGKYTDAASRFNQGDSSADHYNRGNALAQNGDLEAALDAYDTALERDPELAQARQNRALVEDLLRQQKEQQQAQEAAAGQPGEDARQPPSASPGSSPSPSPGKADRPQAQTPEAPASTPQAAAAGPAQAGAEAGQPAQPGTPPATPEPAGKQPAAAAENATDPTTGAGQAGADAASESLDGNPGQAPRGRPSHTPSATGAGLPGQPGDAEPGNSAPPLDEESRQALEQWLRQIPDDPAELLRRKFWYEQQQRQENLP
ncbi:VWA domain-containing protein [Pseudomonas sp. N040]|uniref:VWA domain-containing protein n=1 Tax=Pseudomonas sp. N040 TaxID=2785325 RepID=UPI001E381A5B|nr:VWA domain-containing protein [Pseudomonas sp. N040]